MGELGPQEAAIELQQLDRESEVSPSGSQNGRAASKEFPAGTEVAATRLRVQLNMSSVTVIGDSSVREAIAQGPHRARREGDTLVVESSHKDGPGFVFGGGRIRFGQARGERRLVIRMNPSLPLEVRCDAGALQVEGIHAPLKLVAHAGSVRILDFSEPMDLEVDACSVKASGRISGGVSRINCRRSSVKVDLDPASSVRISGASSLGPINLPDGEPISGVLGGRLGTQLGAGAGALEIESEMSAVNISARS